MLDPRAGAGASLTDEQSAAFQAVEVFLRDPSRRVFAVHGLHASGKTFVLAALARAHPDALVAAPSGKAAAALRDRFGIDARPIHDLLYRTRDEPRVAFIDDASPITADTRDKLLRLGLRLVLFADPGQIGPVRGAPGLPPADAELRAVLRQDAIIRQARAIYAGDGYRNDGPAFRIARRGTLADVRAADVLLCHRNDSRRYLNQLARLAHGHRRGVPDADGGFDPEHEFPRAGERVVVLRNAPHLSMWAGDGFWLDEDLLPGDTSVTIFKVSDSGDTAGGVEFPLASFEGMPQVGGVPGGLALGFGYSLTVHRAQRASWDRVLLLDEFCGTPGETSRWRYTAITRAAQSILVVNSRYT